ncbi:MAG: dihydroorotate dehydrogenase electron transfer subunit [Candidatus Omnitrophota bacterium]
MHNHRQRVRALITGNRNVCGAYFKLSFAAPLMAREIKPGQFIQVKVDDGGQPLLRKPFGFYRRVKNGARYDLEILYEVRGEGTKKLSARKPGEMLDVIGPLGNGFTVPGSGERVMLVAGGVGAAPLVALAAEVAVDARLVHHKKPLVLLGAKNKNALLCKKEFSDLGCAVKVATDDGSCGHHGFVTQLLHTALTTNNQQPMTIYACGPEPMLKAVAGLAAAHGSSCQVLLEEYMACGIGACLGCAVMTTGGYRMVCKDGPVFDAKEVVWR